ncbi:hypothetical protein AVEN_142955-1 [Araneus ventricosus]|uniref:Uncharacterized protein n=1 Tax=Araneus ventricosus TaxID=182803 RepID=A0A4Y2M6T7_ARAVE|nr:hypothetical protein AVEN_142955-1 [Araneus ventricosus]
MLCDVIVQHIFLIVLNSTQQPCTILVARWIITNPLLSVSPPYVAQRMFLFPLLVTRSTRFLLAHRITYRGLTSNPVTLLAMNLVPYLDRSSDVLMYRPFVKQYPFSRKQSNRHFLLYDKLDGLWACRRAATEAMILRASRRQGKAEFHQAD